MYWCLFVGLQYKSSAPPNIDENQMLPHPLDSGLVTQTHDAKHAKTDSFIQPSPAQKTAKNIKLNSHSHANQKTSVTS